MTTGTAVISKEFHPNLWAIVKHFSWSGSWVSDRHKAIYMDTNRGWPIVESEALLNSLKLTADECAMLGSGSDEEGDTEPVEALIKRENLQQIDEMLSAFYIDGRLT